MKMRVLRFFAVFVINGIVHGIPLVFAASADSCARLLSNGDVEIDSTNDLIAYLDQLLDVNVVSAAGLGRLITSLEIGRVENPLQESLDTGGSAFLIHHHVVQRYFTGAKVDFSRILRWAREKLRVMRLETFMREDARHDTKDVHQKLELHPVPPGQVHLGYQFTATTATLTHSIEAMSTQVTQKQWVEIMGENPANFSSGATAVSVAVSGKMIRMQPDHPIESITWWSALVFANALSKKQGLQPAYDLSGIDFIDSSIKSPGQKQDVTTPEEIFKAAARGGLNTKRILVRPKFNSPGGDFYRTSGYRLPTEAEQEHLLQSARTANGNHPFNEKTIKPQDYAFFGESKNGPLAVAQLMPLFVRGKEFYDLYGNVMEFAQDSYSEFIEGGVNPLGLQSDLGPVIRRGSWSSDGILVNSSIREYMGRRGEGRDGTVGFRLVRTLDP